MSKKKQDEKAKNVDNNKNKQNPTQKKTDKKTDKKPKHNKVQPIVPPKSKINPQNSLKCAESTTLRSTDEPDSMRNSTFTSGGKSSTSMFLNKPPANNKKTKVLNKKTATGKNMSSIQSLGAPGSKASNR